MNHLTWFPYRTFIPLHRLLIYCPWRLYQRPAMGRDQHALWNPKSRQNQQPLQRRRQGLVPSRSKRLKMRIAHETLLHGAVASCQQAHSKSQIRRRYVLSPYCIWFHSNQSLQKGNMKWSPIYLFYEIVINGPDGTPGDDGDIHYCCLHGAHKICMIKQLMRSNLNSMAFYVAHCCLRFFTDPLLSSGEQSLCSHQAYVSTLLHPQGSWRAANTWWDLYCFWEVGAGWTCWSRIPEKAWKSIRKHQESI